MSQDPSAVNSAIARQRRYKRLRRYEHTAEARFLTFSCYANLRLFANDQIKDLFTRHLTKALPLNDVQLVAWVIMPDHVHLLVLPGSRATTIRRLLQNLKRLFALEVLRRWRELDAPILARLTDARNRQHFWRPGGGYDRNIERPSELEQKIDYTHDNPVEAGLVAVATDWRWSSARWYAGHPYDGPPILRLECD